MFSLGRQVVAVLSLVLVSRGALAQEATPATEPATAAPAASAEPATAPPKAIGLAESGIAATPSTANSAPEAPAPFRPEHYPPPEARWKTIGLGGVLVVVGYGLGLGTSYIWDGAPGMDSLRTPLIGPVGAIADSRCGANEGSACSTPTVVVRAILAGLSGLAQVGGIGVLTEGVVMHTEERPAPRAQASQWYALPTASKTGAGVCIGTTF